MREKLLLGLARSHANHPWRMILIVIGLTVIFGIASSQLSVTMRWSDLLPQEDPRTIQFNKIVDDFKTGKEIALNAIVGSVMRKTRGKADPREVKDLLIKLIK